jgi:hypothetical protein
MPMPNGFMMKDTVTQMADLVKAFREQLSGGMGSVLSLLQIADIDLGFVYG